MTQTCRILSTELFLTKTFTDRKLYVRVMTETYHPVKVLHYSLFNPGDYLLIVDRADEKLLLI